MDSIFLDRLNAKMKQHLNSRGSPDAGQGLRPFVENYIDSNGKLLEDALSLLKRYWERARPKDIADEGLAHEKVLLNMVSEDKRLLDASVAEFLKRRPTFEWPEMRSQIDTHYEIYSSKVRDEIAFLQAIRQREVSEDRQKWLLGAAVPVVCVILAALLANDARSTLKEIEALRQEMAELARENLVASTLILKASNRMVAPIHRRAAKQEISAITNRLRPYIPTIDKDLKTAIEKVDQEDKAFIKHLESLPQEKQYKLLEKMDQDAN